MTLQQLIEKFWKRELSEQETARLMDLLQEKPADLSDDDYQAFLAVVKETDYLKSRQVPQYQDLFAKIEQKIDTKEEGRPSTPPAIIRRLLPLAASAAAAVVLLLVVFRYKSPAPRSRQLAAAEWLRFSNHTGAIKDTILQDGSSVAIYPGAEISYRSGYAATNREIRLEGRALFTVAPDNNKPFVVFAGGFSTRALGTAFEVNTTTRDRFNVTLLQGKVVIQTTDAARSMKEVYLLPNETFTYDMLAGTAAVHNLKADSIALAQHNAIKQPVNTGASAPDLVYSNLPLAAIFQQLESDYGIVIASDQVDISGKVYSGKFKQHEKVAVILRHIVATYGWTIVQENGVYNIR